MTVAVMPSQVAFDAIAENEHFIPRNPFAVAGYINGVITRFIWTDAQFANYPNSFHIRINVTGELDRGNALDVENGDATPANVEPWIISRKLATDPLMVYCNGSNVAPCVAARDSAFAKAGVYAFIWEATLDGSITGHSMTQFSQTTVGGTAVTDVSLITDQRLIAAMIAHLGGS